MCVLNNAVDKMSDSILKSLRVIKNTDEMETNLYVLIISRFKEK